MRQEPRLLDDAAAHGPEITERGALTVTLQKRAVLGEERLGLVAEGEQGFLRAEALARRDEGEDLVRGHREGAGLARILAERTVPAIVTAERRQRDEDLGGEGEAAAMPLIPQPAGGVEEGRHLRVGRVEQRGGVAGIGGSALADVVERALDLGGGTERRVRHGLRHGSRPAGAPSASPSRARPRS